jgi:hypothetical protein
LQKEEGGYGLKKLVFAISVCIIILAGCSIKNEDKACLINWMHNLDSEQVEAFFWCAYDFKEENGEIELTPEAEKKLISILNNLKGNNIIWNKQLEGITPAFGFRLTIGDENYYINQAEAPSGQSEISFQGKQWWINNLDLYEFMKSFLNGT